MFGDNLKKYRIEKGYSQSELADKLYVTRQCVSKWEKGITQPDLQALSQISELFNVPIDTLVKENGPVVKCKSNFNKYSFIANILVSLFCIISFIALWRFMPQKIPAHWTRGVVDRYGSRDEILLHIITPVTFFAVDIAVFFGIRRVCDKRVAAIPHGVIILFQVAYLIYIVALYAELLTAIGSFSTCMAASIMLCISIAMHPKISKQNALLGVRTSATLSSEDVWNKTNALTSYMFVGFSLSVIIINMIFIFDLSYLCILSYIVPVIVSVVYSYKIS